MGERLAGVVVLKEGRRRREGDSSREALFRFMTPERSDRFETIVSVPILFPMLLLGLREVLDEVLGVDSGTTACSYKVVVVLA